jgi:MoCo/4Fe-4S cofactor protein with predicted Tat translocation signal
MSELIQINPSRLTGKKYWRSHDQLENSPEFRQWVEREFQGNASEFLGSGSRRTLLKLMAASFGLAGLTACRRPVEHILPLSKTVEGYIHGKPLHFATVVSVGGAAMGLIVESNDGRPTKVEGNPRHPYSLGATSAQTQAVVLDLYDPDRAKSVRHRGTRSSWDEFAAWARTEFSAEKQGDGAGLRILAGRSSAPSLAAMRAELLKKYPRAQWIEWDSVSFDNPRLGAQMAFDQPLEPLYRFDKADVVVSLDCDFLGVDSPTVLPVKQTAAKRKVQDPKDPIGRIYVAEASHTLTGAYADHRLRIRSSEMGAFALALAKELNVSGAELRVLGNQNDKGRNFVAAVAKDLAANRGRSLVVAGPGQPPAVHALVALINQALGNTGETVLYSKPVVEATDSVAALKQLTADLNAGAVRTLVILGGNPAYAAPGDLDFTAAMKKASATIALCADENETWIAAEWQLPEAHPFEAWGDARALDGTVSIQQPLIQPLYEGKSALEVIALLTGNPVKAYDFVKGYWIAQWGAGADKKWRQALYDGFVEGSAAEPLKPAADLRKVLADVESALQPGAPGIEVVFRPDYSVWDGRFANNAWMQECPDPMTKMVWDNAALLSPATAAKLGVENGGVLSIGAGGREARVPAMILPGHADDSISLALGYGRVACGRVGQGVGHRVEGLRSTGAYSILTGARVSRTDEKYALVTTQEHHTLIEPITHKKRNIVLESSIGEYREHPEEIHHQLETPEVVNMFPEYDYSKGYQWGMAIDLNACIGCNACLVACVAENNIPVVGKEQVGRGREMHWIRLDRYFTGDMEDPQVVTQPMACQQCEKAPCETVCPVAATEHSPEGINDMAYNRCVGTRYCSNNCPYKVRRFNFFNYHKHIEETTKMVYNPDVTVRMRGVMEKCNYCIQRIEETKITAKAENRRAIKDLEIQTACQQVCPAEAIVFGNINDPDSRVSKMKKQQRDYVVLEELNIKPRTTYLAKLRNPNPELV